MSDKIEPVLTAKEWPRDLHGDWLDWTIDESGLGHHGTIAALNAALDDSDPRKITRETCRAIRLGRLAYPEGSASWRELTQIADALETYLQPTDHA